MQSILYYNTFYVEASDFGFRNPIFQLCTSMSRSNKIQIIKESRFLNFSGKNILSYIVSIQVRVRLFTHIHRCSQSFGGGPCIVCVCQRFHFHCMCFGLYSLEVIPHNSWLFVGFYPSHMKDIFCHSMILRICGVMHAFMHNSLVIPPKDGSIEQERFLYNATLLWYLILEFISSIMFYVIRKSAT